MKSQKTDKWYCGKCEKKDFKELTGENPEDILGNDWENEAEELNDGMDRVGLLKGIPHEERRFMTKNNSHSIGWRSKKKIEPIKITFWETSVETNLEIIVEKLNEIIEVLNSLKQKKGISLVIYFRILPL